MIDIHTFFRSQTLLISSACVGLAVGAGGPVHRRRPKENELEITLGEDELAVGTVEEGRDGRNLANVFPFVGGDRGEEETLDKYHVKCYIQEKIFFPIHITTSVTN